MTTTPISDAVTLDRLRVVSRVRFKEPETDLLGVVYMSRAMFKHMSYPRRIMVRVTALQLRPGPNPTEEDTKA